MSADLAQVTWLHSRGAVEVRGAELDAGLVQSICRLWPNLDAEVKTVVDTGDI